MTAEGKGRDGQPEGEAGSRRRRPPRATETHVSRALKSAYEETVREEVPDDFMDLLGKLS